MKKPTIKTLICVVCILVVLVGGVFIYAMSKQNISSAEDNSEVKVFLSEGTLTTKGSEISDEQKQNIYEQQTATNIRDMILKSDKVQECLVTVRLSSKDTSNSAREPAAAIVLTGKDEDRFLESDIQAIAKIVGEMVPDVKNENISITDSNLNVYPLDG